MDKIGKDIIKASEYIKNGEIVVFPTETVYGIGADAFNEEAVTKIFKAKNRPMDNPLIVHISNFNMLDGLVKEINEIEKKIMDKFMPGPISLILPCKDNLPSNVTANLDTVAIRMPNNKIALEFIEKSGTPIAAPSANVSSKPSGTTINDIYDELNNKVSYFLDGDKTNIGIESTVVRVINDTIVILRPGKISKEDLETICDNVIIDSNCFKEIKNNEKVLSPGMKHKHYSPNVDCILLVDDKEEYNEKEVLNCINRIISENKDNKIKFLVNGNIKDNNYCINIGQTMEEVATNLFSSLRNLDNLDIDTCYIVGVPLKGIGTGIMNRLIRACSYNEVKI